MNDQRKQGFLPYIRQLADLLWLKDWKISINDEAPDQNYIASICCTSNQKNATIFLSEDFLKESAEEQRQTLVHELIHMHFAHCEKIARDSPDFKFWNIAFEYGVDGLADAVAPLLPLRIV